MIIGITLNEVLRDFIGQFAYVYDKYISAFDIEKNPVTDFENLHQVFKFKNKDEMNDFLYLENSLEVFGHGDQTYEYVMVEFNNFLANIDPDEHQVVLLSREAGNSIPATFWFLSKTLCKADNIKFVTKYEDKWDYVDVLITANPQALKNKPEGKISVKVESTYNKDVESDFTINKLTDFLKSEELQNKILNK